MTAQTNTIVTWKSQTAKARPLGQLRVTAIVLFVLVASYVGGALRPAAADGPDGWGDLVQNGQPDAVLQMVISEAYTIGITGPAPDDSVVFDPYMKRSQRGGTLDYDELPSEETCEAAGLLLEDCHALFLAQERQVRFGPSLFTNPVDGGSAVLRPAFGDLLSTYIEETGHSWQEYQYETNGSGGARRSTTRAESDRWAHGKEYQIKSYILYLDGKLITLSDEQRANLRDAICLSYANPMGYEVPAYGAPTGWPYAEGWPTSAPTPEAFQAFCAA